MSLLIWDTFFEEVSKELELDTTFFRERMEEALSRFLEEKVAQSFGLLSVEEGWLLTEQQLEEEPSMSLSQELDMNPSTLRYLYSKVQLSRLPLVVQMIQSRFPDEFITPSHIDKILL